MSNVGFTVHKKKDREKRADITYAIISSLGEIETRDSGEASGDEFLLRLFATEFPMLQVIPVYIPDYLFNERVAQRSKVAWWRTISLQRRIGWVRHFQSRQEC